MADAELLARAREWTEAEDIRLALNTYRYATDEERPERLKYLRDYFYQAIQMFVVPLLEEQERLLGQAERMARILKTDPGILEEAIEYRIAELEGESRVLIDCPCRCHQADWFAAPHVDCRECVRGTATPTAIDHDHEWALWFEKWTAAVDTCGSALVKLVEVEKRAEAAEAEAAKLREANATLQKGMVSAAALTLEAKDEAAKLREERDRLIDCGDGECDSNCRRCVLDRLDTERKALEAKTERLTRIRRALDAYSDQRISAGKLIEEVYGDDVHGFDSALVYNGLVTLTAPLEAKVADLEAQLHDWKLAKGAARMQRQIDDLERSLAAAQEPKPCGHTADQHERMIGNNGTLRKAGRDAADGEPRG